MQIKFSKLNFKKAKIFKKEDSQRSINLYWRLALFLTLIMIFFALFFGYKLFNTINQESTPLSAENSAIIETVNKTELDQALQYFTDRAKKSTEIINSPSPLVDPSL